jgi:hypothetical protein
VFAGRSAFGRSSDAIKRDNHRNAAAVRLHRDICWINFCADPCRQRIELLNKTSYGAAKTPISAAITSNPARV